ncbi:XisH family protein [Lewinella sp. 4G2]|uniref:XisH family protein n=1 Tax=Lewinella sp. 4G2 TaxID=1803372 RepID=UPI000A86E2E7|nr:XisH family protein [Lewinella sp. 4G2]
MAKDIYHDLVKEALVIDGWEITHDPFPLDTGPNRLQIDLGAEKLIAATKGKEKIAVEIKSFISKSQLHDFYEAFGQFSYYQEAIEQQEPDRELYLAVPADTYSEFFQNPIPQQLIRKTKVNIIVYNRLKPTLVRWISAK